MNFYSENQYSILTNQLLDNSTGSTLQTRLQKKYIPKKFSTRWKGLRLASLITSYLCNGLSMVSGSFAIGFFVFLQLQSVAAWAAIFLSIVVASLVALLLEIFKRTTSSNFLLSGFQFRSWRAFYALVVLLLTTISISLSFYGASKLPEATIQPPGPIASNLEDVAALGSDFDKQTQNKQDQIAEKRKQIKTFEKNHKSSHRKGLSSAPIARQGYKNLNDELAKLEQQLAVLQNNRNKQILATKQRNREAVTITKQENKLLLAKYTAHKQEQGYALGYCSIFFEAVFLLCIFFCEFYDYRSYVEECVSGEGGSSAGNKSGITEEGNRRKEDSAARKKTTAKKERTQLIEHTNRDGDVKEYKKTQVLYFISKYQNRIEDYIQKGKEKLAERNGKVLSYWRGRLQEFTE